MRASLPAKVSRTYRLTYYATDSRAGRIIENALAVEAGTAQLKLLTYNPTIVYIFSSGKEPTTFFYAERGDNIEISGPDSDPVFWKFTGNKINEDLSKWREANRQILVNWNVAANSGINEVNVAVSKYVKENPSNPVSTLLLLEYYDRGADEEGFLKCWKSLKGDALDGKWRDVVARADMIADPVEPTLPSQWILKNYRGRYDTLSFKNTPTFLYFNSSADASYKPDLAAMREVIEISGDSSTRVVANILFDPDSLSRSQAVHADTLKNVVQGWVPLGFSDPVIKSLSIRSVPFVIIIDSNGRIVYRGDKTQDAISKFQKLMQQ